ncbi:MAG: hypothetical protein V3V08_16010 [Nannocystaceae bacterium]
MTRQLLALLAIAAMGIAVGGMACIDTINEFDNADEGYGAT